MKAASTLAIGVLIGMALVPLAALAYLRFGEPPVAVADQPFPYEKAIVSVPLDTRIGKDMPTSSPIATTPAALNAGASIYSQQCAFCHGRPGAISATGANMYPHPPQLWTSHGKGVVGVSDDPVGVTYWKVANGIRLSGMPAYDKMLSKEQMWQVSILLAAAAKPLPDDVRQTLKQ